MKYFLLAFMLSFTIATAQTHEIIRGGLKAAYPTAEKKGPNWSPKGEKGIFSEKCPDNLYAANKEFINSLIDPVFGVIYAADSTLNKINFIFSKKEKTSQYREILIVDCDNNGLFDKEKEVFKSEAKDVRGRMWVSFDKIQVMIKFKKETVLHQMNAWYAYPKPGEEGEFNALRYTRNSWMDGTINYEGKNYRTALIDADNNFSFTKDDVWVIAEEGTANYLNNSSIRLDQPVFIDGQAFRLTNYNEAGTIVDIVKTNDVKQAVAVKEAPARPKSDKTLNWYHNLDEALKAALKANKKLFVKWWADWCGPCKELENTTLKDKVIVDMLSKDYLVASIDHDKEYITAQKQNVKALPTMQFFTPGGKEITRYVGFLNAEELEKMIKEIK
jgi:thiol-disulfide isomerase/thioredoxin